MERTKRVKNREEEKELNWYGNIYRANGIQAKYKGTSAENLTAGIVYSVHDIECEEGHEVSKIEIEDDRGNMGWHEAKDFELYAEAAAVMQEAGKDAAQPLLQKATQNPYSGIDTLTEKGLHIGIDIAAGMDMTAEITANDAWKIAERVERELEKGKTVKQAREAGENLAETLQRKGGLIYGA